MKFRPARHKQPRRLDTLVEAVRDEVVAGETPGLQVLVVDEGVAGGVSRVADDRQGRVGEDSVVH